MRNDKFDWFNNNRVATAKHRSVKEPCSPVVSASGSSRRSGAQLLSCAVFIRCLTCSFTRGRLAKDTELRTRSYISPSAKAASLRKRQSTAHSSSADAVSQQVPLVQTAEEQSSRLAATSAGAVFRLTWRPTCCCATHRGRGSPDSERPPPEDRRVASPVLDAGSAVRNWDRGDESGSVERRYSVRERRAPDWFGFSLCSLFEKLCLFDLERGI